VCVCVCVCVCGVCVCVCVCVCVFVDIKYYIYICVCVLELDSRRDERNGERVITSLAKPKLVSLMMFLLVTRTFCSLIFLTRASEALGSREESSEHMHTHTHTHAHARTHTHTSTPVHDALLVAVVDGRCELDKERACLELRHAAVATQLVQQAATWASVRCGSHGWCVSRRVHNIRGTAAYTNTQTDRHTHTQTPTFGVFEKEIDARAGLHDPGHAAQIFVA
jgi:hypothetical protein